jgi:streptomycin 6-kinase
VPADLRHLVLPAVRQHAARGPEQARWVDALPRLLADLVDAWELTVDGPPTHGHTALVVPVRAARHEPAAVLKVAFVDDETRHEALALQRWAGRGAVRLLQADPRRGALLLQRLPGPDLTDLWDVEACEVVAGLYGDLHVASPPQLERLTTRVGGWLDDLQALPRGSALPHRLVEQATALGRDLCADPASGGRLLHGDLHFENVLADDEGRWVAIDPKPVDGDPHHEPAPMLWNRWEEVVASGDVRDAVRRRFHTLVDTGGLDEDRARDWAVVRMVLNASWEVADAVVEQRAPDAEWLTRCVTIAKAVQD